MGIVGAHELVREFAANKATPLIAEAGECAVHLLTEGCYLRYGENHWRMEANKLWRACIKKAKAKNRTLSRRGVPRNESILAKEMYKCAQRLRRDPLGHHAVPQKRCACAALIQDGWMGGCKLIQKLAYLVQSPPWLRIHRQEGGGSRDNPPACLDPKDCFEGNKSSSSAVLKEVEWHKVSEPSERSQLEIDTEILELRRELCRMRQQLSRQAQLTNACELELGKLRECKCDIRHRAAQLMQHACCDWCPRLSQLTRRHAAATRIQRIFHCAANKDLRGALTVSDATVIALTEEVNLLHMSNAIRMDKINELTETVGSFAVLAVDSIVAAANAHNFSPAVDALQTGIQCIIDPTLHTLRGLSMDHASCLIMHKAGLSGALLPFLVQSNEMHALLSSIVLENLSKCEGKRTALLETL
jgi:ribosomal protein L29